ncbi:MAG: response regulator [Planctomycetes bacterium]|nr:response regulator [Planctomycetota bacterium]
MSGNPQEPNLDDILKAVEQESQVEIRDPLTDSEEEELNKQLSETVEAKRLKSVMSREQEGSGNENALKVLVIDDSAIIRKSIIRNLKSSYEVIADEAGSVQQALDLLDVVKLYDFVTLDLNLPGAFGLKFLEGAKERGIDVNVIVVSTENEKGTITQALLLGAKGYLLKPFSGDDLRNALKKFIK